MAAPTIEALDAHALDQRRADVVVREIEPQHAGAIAAAEHDVLQPAQIVRVVLQGFGAGIVAAGVDGHAFQVQRDAAAVRRRDSSPGRRACCSCGARAAAGRDP